MQILAGEQGAGRARRGAGALAGIFALALIVNALAAHAQDTPSVSVRGVVRAEAAATLASELVARITALPVKAGQSFHAGDLLVTFDCARYEADLRAAEAEIKMGQIQVDTNRQLLSHKAAGTNDVALAEAKLAHALASADSLRVRSAQCVIAAPFDGHVVERFVDVHDMPQANAPLMKIVKDGRLELDLIVPSSWAVWLKPGHEFPFDVEETRSAHKARLEHLGAVVDPISRTMKVSAILLDPGDLVRPGMSGAARLTPPAGAGAER